MKQQIESNTVNVNKLRKNCRTRVSTKETRVSRGSITVYNKEYF